MSTPHPPNRTARRIIPCCAPRAAAALLLSLLLALASAPPAHAATYTLINGNAQATFSTDVDGQTSWSIDGINHLMRHWFALAVGSDPEQSVANLTILNQAVGATFDSPTDNILSVQYGDQAVSPNYTLTLDFTLYGGSQPTDTSGLEVIATLKNLSATTLDFRFFQYADFNLLNTANDSSLNIIVNDDAATITQTDGAASSTQIGISVDYDISAYQASTSPFWSMLNDLAVDNLNNTASASNADLAWALQWNFSLAPDQEFTLGAEMQLATIPEPASLALLSLAALALLPRRPRRA